MSLYRSLPPTYNRFSVCLCPCFCSCILLCLNSLYIHVFVDSVFVCTRSVYAGYVKLVLVVRRR